MHSGARALQTMVAMRDGVGLNTFVFLPESGGPRWPVILHRTPYGITAADARDKTDFTGPGCRVPRNPFAARSCAVGATSSSTAMPRSIRTRADGMALKARIASTRTTPRMVTTPSNGLLPSPGAIRWSGCPAPPPAAHYLCRGLDPPPKPARLLRPSRRLQHLRRRGI